MDRLYFDVQQNSDEWHELRNPLITASKFSDFYMSPSTAGYQTAISTIAFNRLGIDVEKFTGNSFTDGGHELEDLGRNYYEMINLSKIDKCGFFKMGEWLGCSPDGLIDDDGIWEHKGRVKANTMFQGLVEKETKKELTIKTNKSHFLQVHFQLYVTGRVWCDYQVGSSGLKPYIQRIYKDEMIFKQIESVLDTIIPEIKARMEVIKRNLI